MTAKGCCSDDASGSSPPFLISDITNLQIALDSKQAKTKIAKTTNTDITTDIQNTTPTELPLTGNQIIMDSDFEVSGNGIKCKFIGRIKVTAVVSNRSLQDVLRATGRINSAINGTIQPVGVDWYNRTETSSGQVAKVAGATLVDILDVSEDDIISIYNTLVSENRTIVLDIVGGSMLLIERLE